MRKTLLVASAALMLAAGPAMAQQKTIKIGFVSTFSGPTAVIGNDMRNSFELALDHLGRKMGGLPVEVIYEDDQQKPEVGKQKTEKLIESDKVDFIVRLHLVERAAGFGQAGGRFQDLHDQRQCRPLADRRRAVLALFLLDLMAERPDAAGDGSLHEPEGREVGVPDRSELCRRQGHAGRCRVATFKGKVVGEELTTWPAQLDFSAELSKAKAANPDSIFVFYPGKAGVQFLSQYEQAGLKGKIPLYTAYTIDELSLPLQKELALGVPGTQEWVNDLPNEANKKFVADYIKKYPGHRPSFYGAQSYDAVNLINSAVVATKGNLSDKVAVQKTMEKADFKSVRGDFKFGNNHFPIQNFYLQDVVKDAKGDFVLKTVATIVKENQDSFHGKCPMK